MNDRKLKQLFSAARGEPAPAVPEDFGSNVVRELRRDAPAAVSLWDQLDALFPRLAWTAAILIALCAAADFGLSALAGPGLEEGIVQISDQWLFAENGS